MEETVQRVWLDRGRMIIVGLHLAPHSTIGFDTIQATVRFVIRSLGIIYPLDFTMIYILVYHSALEASPSATYCPHHVSQSA